jgi:hypothetical protein
MNSLQGIHKCSHGQCDATIIAEEMSTIKPKSPQNFAEVGFLRIDKGIAMRAVMSTR